jgi:hypothetical protein
VLYCSTLTAATFGALALAHLGLGLDERATVTVTFLTVAFGQLWRVFNMRHPSSPLTLNEISRPLDMGGVSALRQHSTDRGLCPKSIFHASYGGHQDVGNYLRDEHRSPARRANREAPCSPI